MIDSLVALMLTGLIAAVFLHGRAERTKEEQIELARVELRRFEGQLKLQSALAKVKLTRAGFPATVDPEWFSGDLPTNPLLGPGHPWVEVALESQAHLEHPAELTAANQSIAHFWYNPFNGTIRARVPSGISDARALEMYNRINECALTTLFTAAPPP